MEKGKKHTELYFSIASLRDFVIPTTSDHADSSSIPEEETLGEELVLFLLNILFFLFSFSRLTVLWLSFQSAFLKNSRVFSLVCTLLKMWRRKIAVIKSCIRSNRSMCVCVCARVSYSETMMSLCRGSLTVEDDRFFFFFFFILKTLV